MKLFITGAGGFIGSHLTEACVEAGHEVRAFVHYNSRSHWGWLEESPVRDHIEVIAGDVRDFDSVSRGMADCDGVLHLAALIGIPYSYVSPLAYVKTNVEGTYNVLEAARIHGLSQVLVTSTSETYGTAQHVPIDEAHPAVGQSPYAATKVGADQLALSYHKSFGMPVKVVRPFNTYGPRQSARAIIPTVMSQILAGRRTLSLGSLDPTRDLTFVHDTAAGFLAILGCDALIGSATNIGMNEEITIRDLVALIADVLGAGVEVETDARRLRPAQSEVERLWCDNTRLMTHTGWRPAHTLRSGLVATAEWLKRSMEHYKPGRYNV